MVPLFAARRAENFKTFANVVLHWAAMVPLPENQSEKPGPRLNPPPRRPGACLGDRMQRAAAEARQSQQMFCFVSTYSTSIAMLQMNILYTYVVCDDIAMMLNF
jgi:hypothetical protein